MAKVLLYCLNHVGQTMSGPAIRYWELAKSLSRNHEVILMIPNENDLPPQPFTIIKKTAGYRKILSRMDVLITMNVTHSLALTAKFYGVKIILDAYDPLPFELLEMNRKSDMGTRKKELAILSDAFNFSFKMANTVICANENQRDLWTGLLLSLKKINPATYDLDSSLKKQIGIVPFGVPSIAPVKQGIGPKSIFKLKETDKIILWGGGIWDWFDPLTLIKAIHKISQKRSDIHLVFMGVKVPNESTERMSMPAKAFQLAKELNILNKHVFFNQDWIPYEQRTSFLLEADIGISTHFDHLETRYSFRTRLLDYIWAGLPIINTEGDSFSKLIDQRGIGLTVPYEDVETLSKAILHLIDHPDVTAKMKENLKNVSQEFHWDKVVKPLEEMIHLAHEKQSKISVIKQILKSLYRIKGPLFPLKIIFARISQLIGNVKAS